MLENILQFFVRPSFATVELLKLRDKEKYIIITIILIFSVLVFSYHPLFGFQFNVISSLMGIILNLLFAFVVYGIGKLLGAKWTLLNTLFFIILSNTILLFGFLLGNLLGVLFFVIPVLITFLWSLVLLSKSLSKVGEVTESKITLIVILSIVGIWLLSSYIIAPLTGLKLI